MVCAEKVQSRENKRRSETGKAAAALYFSRAREKYEQKQEPKLLLEISSIRLRGFKIRNYKR
jgi:hypothetical protein